MQTMMSRDNQNRRSSGFTLIEVLIAFVVMAVGLLALLSFHNSTQTNAAEAKMQAEATSLADGKLQELSSYLTSTDVRLNETTCDTVSESVAGQLTDFTLCWEVENDDDYPNQKIARVSVSWTDRNGNAQDVALSSEVNFRRPTEGAESLLRLVHANNSTSAGGSWESGNGTDQEGENGGSEGNGDGGQDDGGGTDGNNDTVVDNYRIIFSINVDASGEVGGGSNAEPVAVSGVFFSQNEYSVNCQVSFPTIDNFTCETEAIPNGDSWSGEASFASNGTVCLPEGGSVEFNGIEDDDDPVNVNVKVRKNNGKC